MGKLVLRSFKHFLIVFSVILLYSTSFAQIVSVNYLLSLEHTNIGFYQKDTIRKLYYLECDFGSAKIKNLELINEIKKNQLSIYRIDYVYTRYAQSSEFNQKKLDKARLEELYKTAPFLFDDNLIDWRFLRQMKYNDLEHNKESYHGFVIYLRKKHAPLFKKTTEEEIKYITKILKTGKEELDCSSIIIKYRDSISIDTTGLYIPKSKRKRLKRQLYYKKSIWNRKPYVIEHVYRLKDTINPCVMVENYTYRITDTVVFDCFKRNKGWSDYIVVEDVTNSMHPYLAQIFILRRKLYFSNYNNHHFVFFNDGDAKPDGPKGESNGAHYIYTDSLEKMEAFAIDVMRKGHGGLPPENDIEAILYAINQCPECSSVVLIADNSSPIRDLELMNKITKPVRIILCGAKNGNIHHHYIQLAFQTKGSLHTLDKDYEVTGNLSEGDILFIGKQKFIFTKGGLKLLLK